MATAHIIHAFLGFTSTRLGSEVSCPRTLPRKNPEDPVRLEPRTPGLRVKHFTTEPRRTPSNIGHMTKSNSNGDILNTDKVRCKYGIGRVVTSEKYRCSQLEYMPFF